MERQAPSREAEAEPLTASTAGESAGQGIERCRDLGGQQVEVVAVRVGLVEGAETETLPPAPRRVVNCRDDNGSTSGVLVQCHRRRQHMNDERSTDSETGDGAINSEATDQQRRNRIGRLLRQDLGCARTVDPRHRQRHVPHDNRVNVRDHPCRRRVPPPVLRRVPAEPIVQLAGT
jgi:hypothetical protein